MDCMNERKENLGKFPVKGGFRFIRVLPIKTTLFKRNTNKFFHYCVIIPNHHYFGNKKAAIKILVNYLTSF
jgi:hypothetical protein